MTEGEASATTPNVIKISKNKTVGFYAKACEHFLRGVGDKEAFDKVVVSAVGNAIPSAASVADILERRKIGKTTKIETGYVEVEKSRFRPQLKVSIEALPVEPETPERLKDPKKEKILKKVVKAGGKRGVEIEGAADMGGLMFYATMLEEAGGDVDLLVEAMKAMNAKPDPNNDEERKGCSGHIGKTIVSYDDDTLCICSYVPPAKQKDCRAKVWLKAILSDIGVGEVHEDSTDIYAKCEIKKDVDKGIFPMKYRDNVVTFALQYLRKHKLFPEDDDDDDDDEMVFGDDDFPTA